MRAGRGFSLIELMAVLAILAVLAWAILPLAEVSREREREHELQRALWQIRDAIDAYKKVSDASMPAIVCFRLLEIRSTIEPCV